MIKDTKNFKASELEYSSTAKRYGIDNKIPIEYEKNAQELLEFLQQIRDAWKSAILISSGYRCPELNSKVNGSKTSSHMIASAADIIPANGKFDVFKDFIVDFLKDKKFDQCIIEKSKTSKWIHVGIRSLSGMQRKQCLIINV